MVALNLKEVKQDLQEQEEEDNDEEYVPTHYSKRRKRAATCESTTDSSDEEVLAMTASRRNKRLSSRKVKTKVEEEVPETRESATRAATALIVKLVNNIISHVNEHVQSQRNLLEQLEQGAAGVSEDDNSESLRWALAKMRNTFICQSEQSCTFMERFESLRRDLLRRLDAARMSVPPPQWTSSFLPPFATSLEAAALTTENLVRPELLDHERLNVMGVRGEEVASLIESQSELYRSSEWSSPTWRGDQHSRKVALQKAAGANREHSCVHCQCNVTPQWRFIDGRRYCNACYMRNKRSLNNQQISYQMESSDTSQWAREDNFKMGSSRQRCD